MKVIFFKIDRRILNLDESCSPYSLFDFTYLNITKINEQDSGNVSLI
jgi:hypothetical protein